ncbi:MAG TPA: SUMF1/EgtB/PvdO family nonheme iron enzyme [Kofleriaceae bacterium]|nr:SUMF1/EgtB/PvdO family nonheme iron enzyme [Kofleriaceae bacterium]
MDSSTTPELDLFIVHAEADAAFVRGYLLPALELPRDRVLLVDELPLGGLVVSEIDRGVSRSRYTVAVLSPAYLEDRWADFGTELASHVSRRDPRLVPLQLLDCELPVRIDARVALDFRDKDRWAWETARLRDLLRRPAAGGAVVPYPDPRRRVRRRWLSGLLAGVAVGAVLVLAAVWLRPRQRAVAPPLPDMVRVAATSVRLGVFDAAAVPAECRELAADEGCPAVDRPEAVLPTPVATFDLDRREVTNGEYAAWLNANVDFWKSTQYGIVTTRGEAEIPLVWTGKCGDGLTITSESRAQVTPESMQRPVVCVTWGGADEYCRAHGKRLPLQSEWEVAAKGAEARPFPWGAELPRQDVVAFGLRSVAAVHPRDVGSSLQDVSPDGVNDLGGNVAEWVEDGRGDARLKTLRGGGFGARKVCDVLGSRCARIGRDSFKLDAGFRCARSVIDRQLDERRSR